MNIEKYIFGNIPWMSSKFSTCGKINIYADIGYGEVLEFLQQRLASKFDYFSTEPCDDGFYMEACARGFLENAATKTKLTIKIEPGILSYYAEGDVSPSMAVIFLFIMGFFTVTLGFWLSIWYVVCFGLSRNRPKEYIDQVFSEAKLQFG